MGADAGTSILAPIALGVWVQAYMYTGQNLQTVSFPRGSSSEVNMQLESSLSQPRLLSGLGARISLLPVPRERRSGVRPTTIGKPPTKDTPPRFESGGGNRASNLHMRLVEDTRLSSMLPRSFEARVNVSAPRVAYKILLALVTIWFIFAACSRTRGYVMS